MIYEVHNSRSKRYRVNIYTKKEYQRRGIATHMIQMLVEIAREKGVSEISLDATDQGRPLYETLGFKSSEDCMTLCL